MIKNLRKQKGYTQKQLAIYAGVTVRAIAAYEAGERRPSIGVAYKIAAALDIPEEQILKVFYKK